MKRHTREIGFFKDIGKSPIAISVHHVIYAQCNSDCQRCSKRLIMQWIAWIRRNVPFSIIQRTSTGLFACLKRTRTHHIFRCVFELRHGIRTHFAKCIRWIEMGTDEIGGELIAVAILQELTDPGVLRGCRPTDLQPRVDAFDRVGGYFIKREISVLSTGPENGEIGLIPHFKWPLRNL